MDLGVGADGAGEVEVVILSYSRLSITSFSVSLNSCESSSERSVASSRLVFDERMDRAAGRKGLEPSGWPPAILGHSVYVSLYCVIAWVRYNGKAS